MPRRKIPTAIQNPLSWVRNSSLAVKMFGGMSQDNMLHLLLVGKRGCGKSSTGNTIFGQDLFTSGVTVESPGSSCTKVGYTHDGTNIEVTEFPGLFDTSTTLEKEAADMVHTISLMGSGPTAFLYIISLGDRYTERDRGFYERLKALLGQHLTQYIIIIFTRGDDLKRKHETIDVVLSTAPNSLKDVLRECGDRYIVFDNTTDHKETQVSHLMQEVHKLSQMCGGRPYTCPSYGKKGEKMEEEVARILRKVEEEEVKGKKYVQELEEKTKHAQEEAERNKREFERNKIKLAELTCKDLEERINHLESMSPKIMQCLQKLSTSDDECHKWIDHLMKMETDRSEQMKDIKRMVNDKIQILEQKQELLQKQLHGLYEEHSNVMIEVDRWMSQMRKIRQTDSDKRHTPTRSSVQMSVATVPNMGWSKQIKGGGKRKQAQEEAERELNKTYRQMEPMHNPTMNESDPTEFDKNILKDKIEQLTFNDEREGAVGCLAEKDKNKEIKYLETLGQENSRKLVQSKHEKSQDLCDKYPQGLEVALKSINQSQVSPLQMCRLSEGDGSQLYTCPTVAEVGEVGEVGEVSEKMAEVAGSMLGEKEGLEISNETQELVAEEKQNPTVTVKEEALSDKTATNIEVKMEEIRKKADEREKQNKQIDEILTQLSSKRMPEINKKEDEMQVL